MPTGQPLTGERRKYTGCDCYAYHRPRSSAQFCVCECHEDSSLAYSIRNKEMELST